MGFRLSPIFIKSEKVKSDEELLKNFELTNLKRGMEVDFYQTSKQSEKIFIGTKNNCKIVCNGKLANEAFKDENRFLSLENSEIASIIWNETSDVFGFSLINNGRIVRKVMVCDGEFQCDYGSPISEELEIKEDEIFRLEEKEEIVEEEGEDVFKEMVKAEKVCRVANILAKRYIGAGIVEIKERIELNEYE